MYLEIEGAERYRAALYIRLSREDETDGPSESVSNQRAMLEDFARQRGVPVAGLYVDDGWSGTSFDRPEFRRMLRDIEAGRVNMVITKDLSRLGRDYIMTGHYMERYFPEHRVRYISLLDGIDTGVDSSANEITPFRAIMNDMYAKDISKKISSVKRDKQRKGLFIGGKPVYGYQMHPAEKNKIVVDEGAAPVVRRIFRLALEGLSCRQIAAQLNAEGIPSPGCYAGLYPSGTGQWSGERISEMLQNETYIGNMVQGRRRKVSYKSKKCIRQLPEDWVVVEGTHEAIIDRQVWEQTRKLLKSRYAPFQPAAGENVFAGFIRCGDCGRAMVRKGRDRYLCGTYVRAGKAYCSGHGVKRQELEEIVLAELARAVEEEQQRGSLAELFERAENGQEEAENEEREEEFWPLAGVSGILVRRDDSSMRRLLAQMAEEILIFEDGSVELVCLYGDLQGGEAHPAPSSWRQ